MYMGVQTDVYITHIFSRCTPITIRVKHLPMLLDIFLRDRLPCSVETRSRPDRLSKSLLRMMLSM